MDNHATVTQAVAERMELCKGTDPRYLHPFTNDKGTFCPGFNLYAVEHEGVTYAVEADNPGNVSTNLFFRTDGRISLPKDVPVEHLGKNPCATLWKTTRNAI